MAAHRYWRINIQSNFLGTNASLQNVMMASSIGGGSLFGSGTASADSFSAGQEPAKAIGSTSTNWGSSGAGHGWWEYDFGSGNAFDIAETKISPITGFLTRTPDQWSLLGSDDGTTFFAKQAFVATPWATSTPQTFDASYRTQSWDPLIVAPGGTLSGANQVITFSSASWNTQVGAGFISSGTAYWEVTLTSGTAAFIGVSPANPPPNTWVANDNINTGSGGGVGWENTGDVWNNGGLNGGGGGLTYAAGDVIGIAVNGTKVCARKNGGAFNGTGGIANPVTGANCFDMSAYFAAAGGVLPAVSGNGAVVLTANFTGPFANPSPFAAPASTSAMFFGAD